MTVAELIEVLSEMPNQDAEVEIYDDNDNTGGFWWHSIYSVQENQHDGNEVVELSHRYCGY